MATKNKIPAHIQETANKFKSFGEIVSLTRCFYMDKYNLQIKCRNHINLEKFYSLMKQYDIRRFRIHHGRILAIYIPTKK